MLTKLTKNNFFVFISILLRIYLCEKIKLYQTDGRVTPVSESQFKRSLLECSIAFKNDKTSLSFNYNKESKLCELGSNYPEGSTVYSAGWKVYAHIVNGGWSNWHSWGSCSVTCEVGTMTRSRSCSNPSPSNGGQTCQSTSVENGACTVQQTCFSGGFSTGNYFVGTVEITQPEAVAVCEGMSARLVILKSQEKIDFLQTVVITFDHWIGMTCVSSVDCTWFDGTDVNSGFTAWAPFEPGGMLCIWIGWYVNKWDDYHCSTKHKALCEYI